MLLRYAWYWGAYWVWNGRGPGHIRKSRLIIVLQVKFEVWRAYRGIRCYIRYGSTLLILNASNVGVSCHTSTCVGMPHSRKPKCQLRCDTSAICLTVLFLYKRILSHSFAPPNSTASPLLLYMLFLFQRNTMDFSALVMLVHHCGSIFNKLSWLSHSLYVFSFF